MDFYLFQNILPVVIAVAVVAISWYLWRRKSKGFYVNSEQEELRSRDERAQNVSDKDDEEEVTFEEAAKFLQGAGLIKAKDIHYLPADEKDMLPQDEGKQQLTDNEQKKRIKEVTVKDASNIQTYYKSSRLGIKEIESQMTTEELAEEKETQKKQLEEIFKLLETDKDKYGVTTMDDLQAQMKLYTR
ncbi:unnamed protein product [Porites lobata]|uniref:Matrix-remodeling-associated protein 7 helical domain-containing protein n=1 Tax=Porites lobata TaxID=104759 RepID=A0ABN8MYU7_9CNID|nr:unnamed protein product [Porites lobata]